MLSVIMPAYNAERYIKESIENILNQSFKKFELLIYNDSSTDKTLEIIKKYQKYDERIKIFSGKKNISQPAALNFLLRKSKNPYIALNDADDISCHDRFLKQITFLEKNQDYGAVGSFATIIDQNSKFVRKISYPISNKSIQKKLGDINCFAQSSMMIRKKFIFKAGLFRKVFDPAQDYDLWCRLSRLTKLKNIPEYLLNYREHSLSSSSKRREESFFKSEFIKLNFKYLKKNKDLIIDRKIFVINKENLYKLLYNNNDKIIKIENENSYSKLALNLKKKKFINFISLFISLSFKNPIFIFRKIMFYINKTYK